MKQLIAIFYRAFSKIFFQILLWCFCPLLLFIAGYKLSKFKNEHDFSNFEIAQVIAFDLIDDLKIITKLVLLFATVGLFFEIEEKIKSWEELR